jgi:hypothetical protein
MTQDINICHLLYPESLSVSVNIFKILTYGLAHENTNAIAECHTLALSLTVQFGNIGCRSELSVRCTA